MNVAGLARADLAILQSLALMFVMALATDLLGVHTILGAFVIGILVGQSPILTEHIQEELRGLIIALFAPIFFAVAGLSIDLTVLKSWIWNQFSSPTTATLFAS